MSKEIFIKSVAASVKDVSLALLGEDDETVNEVLDTLRARLADQWETGLGPEHAAKIAAAFVRAVAARRSALGVLRQ